MQVIGEGIYSVVCNGNEYLYPSKAKAIEAARALVLGQNCGFPGLVVRLCGHPGPPIEVYRAIREPCGSVKGRPVL